MINTILPPEIADSLQHEIRTRIEDQRLGNHYVTQRFLQGLHSHYSLFLKHLPLRRTLFVELHSDVSILVADMVNYTHLTTRLDVKDLVKILHALFLKFDLAAQQNNVLRIKFLGDSYNCVSGIPHYNRRHAKNCVALALDMIEETQNMRLKVNQDIDMRIGVHSGEVFSGIIGLTKWQYDIWSRDVDIANRLETYGKPGMVHLSQTTLSMLDNEYEYEERGPLNVEDPILQKAHIKTYLIGPQKKKDTRTRIVICRIIPVNRLCPLSRIFRTLTMVIRKRFEPKPIAAWSKRSSTCPWVAFSENYQKLKLLFKAVH